MAAASPLATLVGLDLEPDEPLPEDVLDTVLLPQERSKINDLFEARLVFCLKECAYKAQFPLTRQIFGFDGFMVDWGSGEFQAQFQMPVGPFSTGQVLRGRYARSGGFIVSGVVA